MNDDEMNLATPSARRQGGFFFTGKQFLFLVSAVISCQVAVNIFAFKSFVKTTATEVVEAHDKDMAAHPSILERAATNDEKVIHRLDDLRTSVEEVREKLARVEGVILANGNGGRR